MFKFLLDRIRKSNDQQSANSRIIVERNGSVRLNLKNKNVQNNILKAVNEAKKMEQQKQPPKKSISETFVSA